MSELTEHTSSISSHLPWDSEFLGISVAKLDPERITASELAMELTRLQKNGTRLVYWAADPSSITPAHLPVIATHHGIQVDQKTEWELDLHSSQPNPLPLQFFTAKATTPELEALAIRSGHLSRFFADPSFPQERASALYRLWIQNSVAGQIADAVLIWKSTAADPIQGLVTLKNQAGSAKIGLVAVAEAVAGKGIGTLLMNQAIQWSLRQGARTLSVVTQKTNTAACRLYEKVGFSQKSQHAFFHFWLKEPV